MTQIEIDARINVLVQQRNSALDHIAILAGQIAILEQQLRETKRHSNNNIEGVLEQHNNGVIK